MELKFSKRAAYVAMVFLMFVWGLEYVAVRVGQEVIPTISLLFIKYLFGVGVAIIVMATNKKKVMIKAKHIPGFVICALIGEILYYYCEYRAVMYMPVALVTVMLTFAPIVSALSERVLYKTKLSPIAIVAMFICAGGVAMIIGMDIGDILKGRLMGYILCIIAVFLWVSYNFVIEGLEEDYDSISLTFYLMICVVIMLAPVGIYQLPSIHIFADMNLILAISYLGFICEGVGFFVYVACLRSLGSTPIVTLINLLPITTAFFGWIALGEHMNALQILGIGIVIVSAIVVVRNTAEKKIDDK